MNKVPIRYLPKFLTRKDKKKVARELKKSRTLYKRGIYYTHKKVASFPHKKSSHIANAQRIYHIENMKVNGKQIKCTVKEHSHGLMEENILENIQKIKRKVLENSSGQMEGVIEVNG